MTRVWSCLVHTVAADHKWLFTVVICGIKYNILGFKKSAQSEISQ